MGAATGEGVINIQLYDSIYMQRGVEISVVDSSTTCKDWIVDSTEVLIRLLVKLISHVLCNCCYLYPR